MKETTDPNCLLGTLEVPPDGEYGFSDDEPEENKDLFDAFEEVFSDPTKLPATGTAPMQFVNMCYKMEK